MLDLAKLTTETRNKKTMDLDQMTPLELAAVMNQEDAHVVSAIKEVLPEIATAIQWATDSLRHGGRIIYIGAGTSGRLGVLDAVECPPTFGVSPQVVVGLMAGGETAFVKAVEGAEDSTTLCTQDLKNIGLNQKDIVIGLAASGRTPYVIYGLFYANTIGCKTVGISCNKQSEVGTAAQLAIEPVPGPEILTGSTRLKSGTAQKMILNMISTGGMVGIGKIYQNLMVDVQQTNEKLVVRAQNITIAATGCTREDAKTALCSADGQVKTAIVMILLQCSASEAKKHLEKSGGHVRKTLEQP